MTGSKHQVTGMGPGRVSYHLGCGREFLLPSRLSTPQNCCGLSMRSLLCTEGFRRIDKSYPALVDEAVPAALMELGGEKDVAVVADRIAEQSPFAVPKDAAEDRWISCLEITNKLVDPARLPRQARGAGLMSPSTHLALPVLLGCG